MRSSDWTPSIVPSGDHQDVCLDAVAGEFQQIAPPLKNTRWKAISCRVEGGDPILATHTGGFPAEAR